MRIDIFFGLALLITLNCCSTASPTKRHETNLETEFSYCMDNLDCARIVPVDSVYPNNVVECASVSTRTCEDLGELECSKACAFVFYNFTREGHVEEEPQIARNPNPSICVPLDDHDPIAVTTCQQVVDSQSIGLGSRDIVFSSGNPASYLCDTGSKQKFLSCSIQGNVKSPEFKAEKEIADVDGNRDENHDVTAARVRNVVRALRPEAKLWPKGKIYYEIDGSIYEPDLRNKIHIGLKALSDSTCVKFIQRNSSAHMDESYLAFFRYTEYMQTTCLSEGIGYLAKYPQRITVTPNQCQLHPDNYAGIVVHETMHALGFYHEFQREDRDYYINLPEDFSPPILPGKNTAGVPYNHLSITQYDYTFGFTEVENRPAGYPKPLGTIKDMGQECLISAGDRTLVDRVYAHECGLTKPVPMYKKGIRIPGTNCNMRFHPKTMDDEGMEKQS